MFGLIAGWIIGAQQAGPRAPMPAPAAAAAPAGTPPASRPAQLDQQQVQALTSIADREPSNPRPRAQLANLYFDAEKYDDAIKWYEAAMKLEPGDPNLSTDLGVSYYYTKQNFPQWPPPHSDDPTRSYDALPGLGFATANLILLLASCQLVAGSYWLQPLPALFHTVSLL